MMGLEVWTAALWQARRLYFYFYCIDIAELCRGGRKPRLVRDGVDAGARAAPLDRREEGWEACRTTREILD